MNSFLKALRLAAVCLLPFALMAESDDTSDAKASTPMGELYLSLPFCQDQALAHAFPIRAVELKRAVALEKESGACFKRLASIHPEFEGSGEEGLAELEGFIEFALASSLDPESGDFKALAARRIACETAGGFFSAAALQKTVDDLKGMTSSSDAIKNVDDFSAARAKLLESMAYDPPVQVRFDADKLETMAAAPPPPLEKPLDLDLTVADGKGHEASFKLAELLKPRDGSLGIPTSALGSKRVWMLIGREAAVMLLNPKSGEAERMLGGILAKLAISGLAKARANDAKALLTRLDEELKTESQKPPGPVLASVIARRNKALSECCRAYEAAADSDGAKALAQYEAASGSKTEAKREEPPDPNLVETQEEPKS